MAIVDYLLGSAAFKDRTTVVTATVPLDDSLFIPDDLPGDDPVPTFDAEFEGPITLTIAGPGRVIINIWRGTGQEDGRNPWRSSESLFPGGMTAGVFVIDTGGAVKALDDITSRIHAEGQ